jgi:predicted enzyme related to lactoylglutathione lyase
MTHHDKSKIEHVELASKDPVATRQFLEKVFGWKFTVMEMMEGYAIHGAREGAEGSGLGVRSLQGPEHPGSVPFVTVSDIDETVKTISAAGGKVIVPKMEIPGFGWSAVYLAPGDVVQGLYQKK